MARSIGSDINSVDEWNRTKLFQAVEEEEFEQVISLLRRGADPNIVTVNGVSPLMVAGNAMTISALIQHGGDVNYYSSLGFSALQKSIGRDPECLQTLISQGADVNLNHPAKQPSNIGWAPLHHAAIYIDPRYTHILLQSGADPNLRLPTGDTALHLAAGRRVVDSQWELSRRSGNNGNTENLALLVAHGADVHAMTGTGYTPLHAAAEVGSYDAARILIKHGAWATIETSYEATPVSVAKSKGHTQLADYLEIAAIVSPRTWRQLNIPDRDLCILNPTMNQVLDAVRDSYRPEKFATVFVLDHRANHYMQNVAGHFEHCAGTHGPLYSAEDVTLQKATELYTSYFQGDGAWRDLVSWQAEVEFLK